MSDRARSKKILIPLLIVFLAYAAFILFAARYYGNKFAVSVSSEERKGINDIKSKSTIVFSYGGLDFGGNIKKQISLFQKENPDVEVKIQQLPGSSDYQRSAYESAFYSGDSSIDVISADIIWTAEFASNNWVLPLDCYLDEEMKKEYFSNIIEGCSYNGKLYAVPKRTDAPFLYYRKDILGDNPPKTYSEMVDIARKNMNFPGIKYGYVFQGNSYEGLVCNALEFIWNNGGEVLEGNKILINSPQAIEGLQIFIDIVNSDICSHDVLNFLEDDARVAFQDGSAIFMRNWPFAYKQLTADESKVKGKFGIAALPIGPKGKSSSGTLGGWNYMINSNSKNPDLAWKFIKWMSSYEMQVLDTSIGGTAPTRKDVYNDPEVRKINPVLPQIKNVFATARLRPVSPYYPGISESMQKNFHAALSGKISAKTAIENIEKDMNLYILESSKK